MSRTLKSDRDTPPNPGSKAGSAAPIGSSSRYTGCGTLRIRIGAICHALAPKSGERVLLFVNGFGATPLMELYLMYHAAARQCAERGLSIARSLVGNYTTSLDMAGCSLTLTKLDDPLIELWDAPVHTPGLRWGR